MFDGQWRMDSIASPLFLFRKLPRSNDMRINAGVYAIEMASRTDIAKRLLLIHQSVVLTHYAVWHFNQTSHRLFESRIFIKAFTQTLAELHIIYNPSV